MEENLKREELEISDAQLISEQNFPLALVAGLLVALISAVLWAVITVATNYQIGYMALAVGAAVGFTVRFAGKGVSQIFGITGAVLALLGCLLGNLFSGIGFLAHQLGAGYFDLLKMLDFNAIVEFYKESFDVIDLLFYGIAVYEGYRFSFRVIKIEEKAE
jgi:hypothetical protein